jgi:RNA methyltransferase, TrmH family
LRELFVAGGDPALASVRAAAEAAGVPVVAVSAHVLEVLSTTATPQGVVAVANAADSDLADLDPGAGVVVVLAGVRDPGNAGTLVRSSAAAGAAGLVFCHGSVDPWHPKVVRAASGSLWRIRVVRGVALADALGALRELGLRLVATAASAPVCIYDADLSGPIAIVLGNESWGFDEIWRGLLDATVGIPLEAGVESLNVAVAGSITLFEAARQRRMSAGR